MIQEITTGKIPIRLWLADLEEGARRQAENLSNLPFAFRHVALMPDAHQGFGMPIGGVLATRGAIIPNAVGVDIGCGMCSMKTTLTDASREDLTKVINKIRNQVPLGFKWHKKPQDPELMPRLADYGNPRIASQEFKKATQQLGTLGGGNHFIELQRGDDGFIWVMVHSGSRNIGKQVADYYNKLAKKMNQKGGRGVDPKWDLAWLDAETPEADEYFREMRYCTDFALANRRLMMERIRQSVREVFGDVNFFPIINIAHNYAALEEHFGEKVFVHRKGATSAKSGETGIIPGSQGAKSYIVEGLGNPDSFMSCSHGAGRVMGRREARRRLDLRREAEMLESRGIIHSLRSPADLDEAASCYKDISMVMANQKDLVRIIREMTPLAVVKG